MQIIYLLGRMIRCLANLLFFWLQPAHRHAGRKLYSWCGCNDVVTEHGTFPWTGSEEIFSALNFDTKSRYIWVIGPRKWNRCVMPMWNYMVSVPNSEPAIVTGVSLIFLTTFGKFIVYYLEACHDRCLPRRWQFIICKFPLYSGSCIWEHVKWTKKTSIHVLLFFVVSS